MDPLNDKSGLKVGFWNVNRRPEEKSKEEFFLKQIQLFDIIFLTKTWHREDSAKKKKNAQKKYKTERKSIWRDFSLL